MYFLEKSLQKYDVIGDEACIRRTLHGGYKKPKECGVKQTFGIFGELSEEFGVKKTSDSCAAPTIFPSYCKLYKLMGFIPYPTTMFRFWFFSVGAVKIFVLLTRETFFSFFYHAPHSAG